MPVVGRCRFTYVVDGFRRRGEGREGREAEAARRRRDRVRRRRDHYKHRRDSHGFCSNRQFFLESQLCEV